MPYAVSTRESGGRARRVARAARAVDAPRRMDWAAVPSRLDT